MHGIGVGSVPVHRAGRVSFFRLPFAIQAVYVTGGLVVLLSGLRIVAYIVQGGADAALDAALTSSVALFVGSLTLARGSSGGGNGGTSK